MSVSLILLIVALILFGLAAVGVMAAHINLISAGLFFMALSSLVGTRKIVP